MFERLKNFLRRIQNSDEATKKKWLIGASAVSMILVVGLWLIYIQSTIKVITNQTEEESVIGFWQVLKNGLRVIFHSIKDNIKTIISEINKSRTIVVE